jgi:uncharacterized RDD family membrane protein YckC
MTQNELEEIVGKISFFSDDVSLSGALNYKSGIREFDSYLNGKTLKDINGLIQLSLHPKGIAIKIAKGFSTIPFGINFSEIACSYIVTEGTENQFVIERINGNNVVFSINQTSVQEAMDYFENNVRLKFCEYKNRIKNGTKAKKDDEPEIVLIDSNVYAGFWLRFLAWLIDYTIFIIVTSAVWMLFDLPIPPDARGQYVFRLFFFSNPLGLIIGWLYFAFMESGDKQGTLGKMIVKIKVTDLNGNKISFGRASGRFWAKLISGLILGIGYFIAGFTAKKQAQHDLMAKCLVLKR